MPDTVIRFTQDELDAVLRSKEYEQRFRGRESVIISENPADTYHRDSLENHIKYAEDQLRKGKLSSKDIWILKNSLAKSKSWLKQVEWIEEQVIKLRSNAAE